MGQGSKIFNNEVSVWSLSTPFSKHSGSCTGYAPLQEGLDQFHTNPDTSLEPPLEPWPAPTWCFPRTIKPIPMTAETALQGPHFQPHILTKLLHQRLSTHLLGTAVVKPQNRVWSLMGLKVLLVFRRKPWGGSRSEVSALCQAHHTFPGVLLLIMQIVSWDTAALPQLLVIPMSDCAHKFL